MQRDPRTYEIIGAAMEVHRELGPGFLEAVCQETFGVEMTSRQIPHEREVRLPITYKGQTLNTYYVADFVCFSEIGVEVKALSKLTNAEEAQILNYLKATGYHIGLLINFGAKSLQYKRFICSRQ